MISLWDFSNSIYSASGVENECLGLQDKHGLDVNLVLFCVYTSIVAKIKLTEQDLHYLDRGVSNLRLAAIEPLRHCRRAMKQAIAILKDNDRERVEQLRVQVKHLELTAERLEQEWLGRWLTDVAATRPSEGDEPKGNLMRYLKSRGLDSVDVPFPHALFQAASQTVTQSRAL